MQFDKKLILALTIAAILGLPVFAYSAAQITIDTLSEKQDTIDINGVLQTHFVQTEGTTPGDTLRFTLIFRNNGDTVAENVVLDNPIPPNSSYLADSATTEGTAGLLFSIDGGASYSEPSRLTYVEKYPDGSTETRIAPPEKYTHIRWQLPPLPAGAAGQVSFNVFVK